MSAAFRSDTLRVPGATLHYEVGGSGPLLLLIPGGPTDSGAFAGVRGALSERYTVVSYDPRGLSRSSVDNAAGDATVPTFADDAHRLLAALGSEPASVFGHSSGALVGLELVSRHPEQVRAVVAYEPPLTRLLDDAAEHARVGKEIHDTYLAEGVGPAMAKFMASAGLDQNAPPPAELTAEMAEGMARMQGNLEFFLGHMWVPLGDYAPDIAPLRSLPIVVAVGEAAKGQLAHRAAAALAEQLGREPVFFPGDHGFDAQPQAFADLLHDVLDAPAGGA